MRPVATLVARSVVCVLIGLLGHVSEPGETAESTEMPFGGEGQTRVGPEKHALDAGGCTLAPSGNAIRRILCARRVVHGSILCDPIQPNPSAD